MKLSKGWIILIVVVLAALLLFSWGQSSYNNLITKDQVVQQQWAQVEMYTSGVRTLFRTW